MNHLLIGLGGTGGRVLKAFRKLTYQSFRDQEPEGVVLDYLFVDSDPKSFLDEDPSWTVLGHSVQLPKRSQLLIAQANLNAIVNDLNAHPNLKPWVGDRQAWGEILAGLNIDAAGGQKRRLGRFLFAMSARRFRDSIANIVQDMQSRGDRSTDLTMHIFCGLAGGTGSGALIDTIAQLRAMYPDPKKRIVVYAYLPDLNPPARWNTGNYHANAYAALLELNALSAGAWAPFDVVNGGGPVANAGQFWFNGCYVFSDENDQGYRSAVDKDLPDLLADFVYHKTVIARRMNWDGLVRMENSENGDGAPETASGARIGQRSVRYLSFGIRSLSFPEETIREYLSYDFVAQALNQLNYNNWQDNLGYLEQPRPRADAEFVAERKQREDWRLTDEHLRLSRPIIDTEGARRWRSYEEEWQEWRANYLGLAQQVEKLQWLNELTKLFQNTWATNFRGPGVQQFFQAAERDRRGYATSIRNRVEATLFEEWRNGSRSLSDCGRVVDALLRDLAGRQAQTDDWIQKREDAAADLQRQFAEIERRWDRLRIIPGEREREVDKASFLLREHYTSRTLAESGRFSKKLMEELGSELQDLKASLSAAATAVGAAADQALKTVQARAPDRPGAAQEGSYVTTLENAPAVETVRRKLVLNEEEMRTHTATVRARIAAALGQQPTFAAFTRRFGESDIRNILVATSEENVASAHQRLITEKSERVVGVSVIDKLRDQWGDNPDRINRETAQLARSAGRFVVFDEAEQNKYFEGRSAGQRAVETFAVMLPNPPEHKEFVDLLKAGFRNARAGGDVDFIASGEQANSMTMVSLVNLFPLRFVRLVKGLKARYDQRLLEAGRDRAVLEIHTEGGPESYPELFVPERTAVAAKLRPLLLLGIAVGVVSGGKDQRPLSMARKDKDGFDLDPVVLGASLAAAAEDASEKGTTALRETIAPKLSAYSSGDALTGARDAMLALVDEIKAARGGDAADPEVSAWSGAARDAMKILRGEATL